MENREQRVKGHEMLDRFAMNVLIFFIERKKNAAKISWNHLMGAATMYAFAIHDGEKTASWFAENALKGVCELYGENFDVIEEFLEK